MAVTRRQHRGQQDDQGGNLSSQLVIPYWNGDDGNTRPLPGTVVSWACPSIVVTSGPFVPGSPVTITVTVRNYGNGTFTPLSNVSVFWASPSLGFAVKSAFGTQQPVPVPTHGRVGTTSPITDTIPASAGPHVCLLASASFLQDTPGPTPDPVNDRHWAQLNLFAVTVGADGSFYFTFWAGNPHGERALVEIVARPVADSALPALRRLVRADPAPRGSVELSLNHLDVARGVRTDRGNPIEMELRPGERKSVYLEGRILEGLPAGQFAAIEVEQHLKDSQGRARAMGTLGLILSQRRG